MFNSVAAVVKNKYKIIKKLALYYINIFNYYEN